MTKIVIKTALKTLLAVVIALAIAFTVASLGFPSSMAGFFEKTGNYSFAAGYASLAYTYSGKADDLARCFQDSAEAKNDKNTVKFGRMLFEHEDFDTLCEDMSEKLSLDYRQYASGKICVSEYVLGDFDGALKTAMNSIKYVDGFPANNPLVQLTVALSARTDKPNADELLTAVRTITPADGQEVYYQAVVNVLTELTR